MSIWKFVLIVGLISLFIFTILCLIAGMIERICGKRRAKKFTDFIDQKVLVFYHTLQCVVCLDFWMFKMLTPHSSVKFSQAS